MDIAQYEWTSCPESVRNQMQNVLYALQAAIRDDLIGVYLHGSLALGCFNPEQSDVDLLAVTQTRMSTETKRFVAELLLRSSTSPAPIEISFLLKKYLDVWQYPTLFDFHYSEDWRDRYIKELSSGKWRDWNKTVQEDPDLAAHITVVLKRGICLYGRPVDETFCSVPEEDYIASIVEDFRWGRKRIAQHPRNFILNACRVCMYLSEDQVCSKDEAATWALLALNEDFKGLVEQALEVYRGDREEEHFDVMLLDKFAGYVAKEIGDRLRGRLPYDHI